MPVVLRARSRLGCGGVWRPVPSATATNGWSTGRRCGPRWRTAARWGLLVARTDPDVPKHRGLTYFVIDMDQPGVEVRGLHQITGEAEFNEVFFSDARVPDTYRLGEVGEGWRVSMTTLMNERVAIGSVVQPRGSGAISAAVAAWKEKGHTDAARRDELTALWIEAEVLRLTNLRATENRRRGTPGPEGSTSKLHWAELNKRITEFTVSLLGADGLLYPNGYTSGDPSGRGSGPSPAAQLPQGEGQLDRGRDLGDHAEHPRRAGPRASWRAPGRQGSALEGRSPQLSLTIRRRVDVVACARLEGGRANDIQF